MSTEHHQITLSTAICVLESHSKNPLYVECLDVVLDRLRALEAGAERPEPYVNSDGQTFPASNKYGKIPGMTLRQWYAVQVMDKMVTLTTDYHGQGNWDADRTAKAAFKLADAMIAAGKETQP
jgi:hypothetical protein